jgi:nucleotide-binding universal stress UspA family protein
MKVLLAVDGSEASLAALDALVDRARWFSDPLSIHLAFVHPAVPYARAAAWAGKEAVERHYQEESLAALKPAEERLAARNIPFERVVLVGDAAQEITRHATASHCDMIAMGTRGHTTLANLVLGSTATKVLASATVPVLFPR